MPNQREFKVLLLNPRKQSSLRLLPSSLLNYAFFASLLFGFGLVFCFFPTPCVPKEDFVGDVPYCNLILCKQLKRF